MAPVKTLDLVTTNLKRTKAELRQEDGTPIYSVDFSFVTTDLRSAKPGRHSIVLQAPSSSTTPTVLGTCDFGFFSSLRTPIHLGFGDPELNPDTIVWEDMRTNEVAKTSNFELSIDLGGDIGRKVFEWRRTHDVENQSSLVKKLDLLHLKLIDQETEMVVARFVHNFMLGSKKGTFEFEEFEGGSDWTRVVVLSGMAAQEYTRKMLGYSW
jgi:hypothetical protein